MGVLYQVIKGNRCGRVTNSINGYTLEYFSTSKAKVHFWIPEFGVQVDWDDPVKAKKASIKVTCRDFCEYNRKYREKRLSPDYQYVEVGAGLGGYIHNIIDKFGNELSHRPIIIDPADYSELKQLLIYARGLGMDEALKRRCERLITRCELYQDPRQVDLINLTLHEAFRKRPEIQGIADVVIDFFGARYYGPQVKAHHPLSHYPVDELEKRLLKPFSH